MQYLTKQEVKLLAQDFVKVRLSEIDLEIGAKTFNRPLNDKKVRGMAEIFDPLIYSPPILYPLNRSGRKLYGVIDGQHTLVTINRLKPDDIDDIIINARVVDDATPKARVSRFKRRNTHGSAATETDKFWSDVHAKERDALRVKEIIESYDISVLRRRPHNTPAIINMGKLRELFHKYSEEVFDTTFAVIHDSFWDKKYVQYKAIENYFILGLMQLVEEHPDIPHSLFKDFSAIEIEAMSHRMKVGGHKNRRIYAALNRLYKQLIKEYE